MSTKIATLSCDCFFTPTVCMQHSKTGRTWINPFNNLQYGRFFYAEVVLHETVKRSCWLNVELGLDPGQNEQSDRLRILDRSRYVGKPDYPCYCPILANGDFRYILPAWCILSVWCLLSVRFDNSCILSVCSSVPFLFWFSSDCSTLLCNALAQISPMRFVLVIGSYLNTAVFCRGECFRNR